VVKERRKRIRNALSSKNTMPIRQCSQNWMQINQKTADFRHQTNTFLIVVCCSLIGCGDFDTNRLKDSGSFIPEHEKSHLNSIQMRK
jgi:hypothetical protein